MSAACLKLDSEANFILDLLDAVVNGTILSSFEFGGQKCSACSRLYVPDTLWPQVSLVHLYKNLSIDVQS